MIEVTIPSVGESISEVQIAQWHKAEGDWVAADENLVDLETEKASVQVPAPTAGYVRNIRLPAGEFAKVGDVLCEIEEAEAPAESSPASPRPAAEQGSEQRAATEKKASASSAAKGTSAPAASPTAGAGDQRDSGQSSTGHGSVKPGDAPHVMPAASRLMEEHHVSPAEITPTGPGGRILKEDVQAAIAAREHQPAHASGPTSTVTSAAQPPLASAAPAAKPAQPPVLETGMAVPESRSLAEGSRMEEVRPMSMIRRTIAARLVQAQHNAALLTTFNEINMKPIIEIRNKYRDAFQKKHGVKLGFMSFFVKASVEALRRFPAVNAEIRGNNIVYKYYHDIGIAIGGGKGLVVPVLRNCESMTFADIERAIADYAAKAAENRLMPEDLEGGTFTISNGGVYGSLLSTPIVNPPQSAILGLHAIQERPMAVDGQVVILPMMYVALTYDHRIIDGREAVTFLRTIKEICEDPARLFLEI